MKVDSVLILGAGLGTRMGPVGKSLPKLLWPVFEKSLLELQVEFANSFSPKKIFINTHYEAKKIHDHIESKGLNIEVLHEDELLDIGGGIHNLAEKLNYNGTLLILNGDQFLFFDESTKDKLFKSSESHVATLVGLEVDSKSGYNQLLLEKNILSEIAKPDGNKNYLTYSGISLINLDKLSHSSGASKFFETVANYKKERIAVIEPSNTEYCDFGTANRYLESMRSVLNGEFPKMYRFLVEGDSLLRSKIRENFCYNSSGDRYSINLSDGSVVGNGSIVIGEPLLEYPESSIVFGDLVSKTT